VTRMTKRAMKTLGGPRRGSTHFRQNVPNPGLLKIEIRFEQPLYPVARRVLGLYSIAGGLPFWAKGAVPVLAGSLKLARSTAIHSIMPVTIT